MKSIRVDDSVHLELKRLARERSITISALIREFLYPNLTAYEKERRTAMK